jgi:hypothetical protein
MITTHKDHLIQRCNERGYKLEDVMECVVSKNGDMWTIDVNHPKYPSAHKMATGVGTELKKLLSMLGIKTTPDCSCNTRARIMNEKGINWVKQNQELIISWMREEAAKRKLPFFKLAAQKILSIAISRAEKKQVKNG